MYSNQQYHIFEKVETGRLVKKTMAKIRVRLELEKWHGDCTRTIEAVLVIALCHRTRILFFYMSIVQVQPT